MPEQFSSPAQSTSASQVQSPLQSPLSYPAHALALRRHWATVSSERLAAASPVDWFGYSVFSVSNADYLRIRQLYADFYQRLRGLIADSQPAETVGLLTLHLLQWKVPDPEPAVASTVPSRRFPRQSKAT